MSLVRVVDGIGRGNLEAFVYSIEPRSIGIPCVLVVMLNSIKPYVDRIPFRGAVPVLHDDDIPVHDVRVTTEIGFIAFAVFPRICRQGDFGFAVDRCGDRVFRGLCQCNVSQVGGKALLPTIHGHVEDESQGRTAERQQNVLFARDGRIAGGEILRGERQRLRPRRGGREVRADRDAALRGGQPGYRHRIDTKHRTDVLRVRPDSKAHTGAPALQFFQVKSIGGELLRYRMGRLRHGVVHLVADGRGQRRLVVVQRQGGRHGVEVVAAYLDLHDLSDGIGRLLPVGVHLAGRELAAVPAVSQVGSVVCCCGVRAVAVGDDPHGGILLQRGSGGREHLAEPLHSEMYGNQVALIGSRRRFLAASARQQGRQQKSCCTQAGYSRIPARSAVSVRAVYRSFHSCSYLLSSLPVHVPFIASRLPVRQIPDAAYI